MKERGKDGESLREREIGVRKKERERKKLPGNHRCTLLRLASPIKRMFEHRKEEKVHFIADVNHRNCASLKNSRKSWNGPDFFEALSPA